jgi:polyisoprenoid-binding protein YceI
MEIVMTNRTKIALAAALFAALATPALAAQDEWTVDSGRYVNGQTPSYTTTLVESRNAAVIQNRGSFAAPIVPDRTTALGN